MVRRASIFLVKSGLVFLKLKSRGQARQRLSQRSVLLDRRQGVANDVERAVHEHPGHQVPTRDGHETIHRPVEWNVAVLGGLVDLVEVFPMENPQTVAHGIGEDVTSHDHHVLGTRQINRSVIAVTLVVVEAKLWNRADLFAPRVVRGQDGETIRPGGFHRGNLEHRSGAPPVTLPVCEGLVEGNANRITRDFVEVEDTTIRETHGLDARIIPELDGPLGEDEVPATSGFFGAVDPGDEARLRLTRSSSPPLDARRNPTHGEGVPLNHLVALAGPGIRHLDLRVDVVLTGEDAVLDHDGLRRSTDHLDRHTVVVPLSISPMLERTPHHRIEGGGDQRNRTRVEVEEQTCDVVGLTHVVVVVAGEAYRHDSTLCTLVGDDIGGLLAPLGEVEVLDVDHTRSPALDDADPPGESILVDAVPDGERLGISLEAVHDGDLAMLRDGNVVDVRAPELEGMNHVTPQRDELTQKRLASRVELLVGQGVASLVGLHDQEVEGIRVMSPFHGLLLAGRRVFAGPLTGSHRGSSLAFRLIADEQLTMFWYQSQ